MKLSQNNFFYCLQVDIFKLAKTNIAKINEL